MFAGQLFMTHYTVIKIVNMTNSSLYLVYKPQVALLSTISLEFNWIGTGVISVLTWP